MTIKNRFGVANIDPLKIDSILRECADTCIMPYFKNLQDHEVDTKTGPNDLVTIADKKSEAFLSHALTLLYPSSVLIGEEGVSAKTQTTDILKDKNAFIWVADPVDGTWNFRRGKDEFCVMLACVHGGEVVGGWIYDIVGGRMMTAEKGGGAFMNGAKLSVAAPKTLNESTGYAGRKYFPVPMREHIVNFKTSVKSLHTLNCAGHEYLHLASGDTDFAIYSRIRPWDHLAGTLAVKEAGGHVMKWDNTPYTPGDEFGGLVVASQADLMLTLQQTVVNKMVAAFKKDL